MPKKEIVQVNLAAANPNLSPATRFGDLVFVAGQTGRHPITGEGGRDVPRLLTVTVCSTAGFQGSLSGV